MKPVNLLPGDAPVVAEIGGKPSYGKIGGALVGFLAVVGVAGFFAMARVESINSEAKSLQDQATEATAQTAATRSQIGSLGQPVIDSDRQLAQGAEQVVVAAYTERHDFVQVAQELRGIMEGTNGWYQVVTVSSAPTADTDTARAVSITGFMPTKELAASFNERVSATRTLDGAEVESLKTVRLADVKTKRVAPYWKFTISADLVDTEAPFVNGGAVVGDGTGTTVGDGGGDETFTLSLEPKPVERRKAAAPVEPAKPRNPFDVAATVARGGAS